MKRGIDISQETVRHCWHRFGSRVAADIRKRRIKGMQSTRWRWLRDVIFLKINGHAHFLGRTVDHEGAAPESDVTKTWDKKTASLSCQKPLRIRLTAPCRAMTGQAG